MKNVNNYKCPACGGGINFNPTSGNVNCEYCDSKFSIEEIEKLYGTPETKAETSEQTPNIQTEGFDSNVDWNTENLTEDWGEDSENMKEYSCPSCGATILCEKTTGATSCPYCDNPTIIEKQFSGALKPNYIIPFKLQKKNAIEALKSFYKGKKLLPDEFSAQNHLEEIKGVYVPFWFFNGNANGTATFETTTERSHRSGNKETITTRHFECIRDGNLDFKMVPVDASEKMPNDLMDSIEPFNYSELKDFSTAYLPGFLADKFDVTVEQSYDRANKRCAATFVKELRKSVKGYDSVRLASKNINFKQGAVYYGLIPVYLLYTKWNNEKYLFAVNGQTGKVVGSLPASPKKQFWYFFKNALISFGIIGAIATAISFI